MNITSRFGRWRGLGRAILGLGALSIGCGQVIVADGTTMDPKATTLEVIQPRVDKIDVLFMIDNSASMADKQAVLAESVPTLIQRLVAPTDGARVPVTDMHIGIISSSLGGMGGDICPDTSSATTRTNDRAQLLNIADGGGTVPEASPSNFLSWFPTVSANEDAVRHPAPPTTPIGDAGKLTQLFARMATGVGQNGCGFEAQLESIYHFLIAPDPWESVSINAQNNAELVGIDTTILTQRADFLRPDSLVLVVALTDEDDSSADPLSVNGQGWYFMATQFAGSPVIRADGMTTTAPRGSSACKTDPASDNCQSCAFAASCTTESWCNQLQNDSECAKNGGYYEADEESLNVRFHRMKERFGVDPQYPLKRYVDGFTSPRIPDRASEHTVTNGRIDGYRGTAKCVNPLFAASLPRAPGDELCDLTQGPRSKERVLFAVIGGVPSALLPAPGSNATPAWDKILGRAPEKFDFTGIDPHMIASTKPRPGLPEPSSVAGDNGSDPIHGRDWDTNDEDLQFACTFDLPTSRDCLASSGSCDCDGTRNPPLCASGTGTSQIKAKAYPTHRPLQVVRALGQQGIAGSICPITLEGAKNAPEYGYNPAMTAIADRVEDAMTATCVSKVLPRGEDGTVACTMIAILDPSESCSGFGLAVPDPDMLIELRKKGAEGVLCVLPQSAVPAGASCTNEASPTWCYVEKAGGQNPAGKACGQGLVFSAGSDALAGAKFTLHCPP